MPSRTAELAKGFHFAPGDYNENKFYPLGFSPTGEFAYAQGFFDGGCGYCPFVSRFDPINDRILEHQVFEQEGKQFTPESLTAILDEWQIASDKEVPLQAFPYDMDGDTL